MKKAARRKISKDEKLATLMLMVPGLVPEHMRSWPTLELLRAYEWHHVVLPVAWGGADTRDNLTPLLAEDHRKETQKRTVPMIAKAKRLAVARGEHMARMAEKVGIARPEPPPAAASGRGSKQRFETVSEIVRDEGPRPQRPKRKLQGRGFAGSRSFKGEIRWRRDRNNSK